MKKIFGLILFTWITIAGFTQNSIGLHAGYLGTYTAVAEYERTDRTDYLLDSMTLFKQVNSFQAALTADIGLGKNFYLGTGFHYSNKGLHEVDFTDSTGYTWHTPARQHYVGISMAIGYYYNLRNSRFGFQAATGLLADFAVGTPNGGALFSGPYYRFFMPFSRFNEVDLSWIAEGGCYYRAGPGKVVLKLTYHYGLSDVLEDAFVVGRTMSYGVSVGYCLFLSK